jgi:hypothetical protein
MAATSSSAANRAVEAGTLRRLLAPPFEHGNGPLPDRFRRLGACCCRRLLAPPTVHHSERRSRSLQRTQVAFAQTRSTNVDQAYEQEVKQVDQALQREDFEAAFRHLERAHVLAQRMTGRHTFIHWRMLVAGLRRGDMREVAGQVPRMVASILFSRLWVPRGNSGRSRVSAFKPMPVPDDLRHLVP